MLGNAENEVLRFFSTLPKDATAIYARDLRTWASRVCDDAILRSYRILNSLGYSRPQVATTLGISKAALDRIIDRPYRDPSGAPVPLTDMVPSEYIDATAEFAKLKK